jgi:hypothetical protein
MAFSAQAQQTADPKTNRRDYTRDDIWFIAVAVESDPPENTITAIYATSD